jgi:acyl-coenzyme A thioesterase PaaI-like protein
MPLSGPYPDHVLVHRFMRTPGPPVPMAGIPLAEAMAGYLSKAEPGRVSLEFTPGPAFLQGGATIQGGIATAMLDFAMAFAVLSGLGERDSLATASLSVSFLKPMLPGRYEARGLVEQQGRRLCFARSELILLASNTIVASATSVLSVKLSPAGTTSVPQLRQLGSGH